VPTLATLRGAREAGRRAEDAGLPVFAAPFRLLAPLAPSAVLDLAADAAADLAVAALRAYTAGLSSVSQATEHEATSNAAYALRESARRYLHRQADPPKVVRELYARMYKDLLADGADGWRLEPAGAWTLADGTLSVAGAGVAATAAAFEHFSLKADFKPEGAAGALLVRGGCEVGVGDGRWGELRRAGAVIRPALRREDAALLAYPGDWNQLWVETEGAARISVYLNGVLIAGTDDAAAGAAPFTFALAPGRGGGAGSLHLRRLLVHVLRAPAG
jgi:hypothetical protein